MKVTPVPIADRPGASQDPAKVIALMKHAEAGDIIQERADTYFVAKILTAVIPGFWSHTQIFIGTADHIRALDNDPSVEELVRELVAASPTRLAGVTRFSEVVERLFPDKSAKLVLSCQSGNRSMQALMTLEARGYTHLVDQRAGWGGARDPFGRVSDQGWPAAGLPTDTGAGGDRSYDALRRR